MTAGKDPGAIEAVRSGERNCFAKDVLFYLAGFHHDSTYLSRGSEEGR